MEPEQQVQPRQIRHSAIVSVLGTTAPVLNAKILNLSEGRTQIWLDQPLRPASLVGIEYSDNLLLGEVVFCQPQRSGWFVGIRVEHALLGMKALALAMGAR